MLLGAYVGSTAVLCPLIGVAASRLHVKDRQIMLLATATLLASSLLMFEYGNEAALVPSYLTGSLVFINASTVAYVFATAVSSKICKPWEVEPMQATMQLCILFGRAAGGMLGDYPSLNVVSGLFSSAALIMLVGLVGFYRQLNV